MGHKQALGCILIILFFTGCQSVSPHAELERKVRRQFGRTLSLAEFVSRYNDELSRELKINAGHEFANRLAASGQSPLTEEEVIAALRVALTTGHEERRLALIRGTLRPRPLSKRALLTIQMILDSGTIPEEYAIDVQVSDNSPDLSCRTYFPTLKLPGGNDIVIRQVYLSSTIPEAGQAHGHSEGWLLTDSNRHLENRID